MLSKIAVSRTHCTAKHREIETWEQRNIRSVILSIPPFSQSHIASFHHIRGAISLLGSQLMGHYSIYFLAVFLAAQDLGGIEQSWYFQKWHWGDRKHPDPEVLKIARPHTALHCTGSRSIALLCLLVDLLPSYWDSVKLDVSFSDDFRPSIVASKGQGSRCQSR